MARVSRTQAGSARTGPFIRVVLISFSVLVLLGGFLLLLRIVDGSDTQPQYDRMYSLWVSAEYEELFELSAELLDDRPMDPMALVMNGFAGFQVAFARAGSEERSVLLEESLQSLRKALLTEPADFAGQIHYVLGKIYYHKGRAYYDLSIDYLEQSIELGYSALDQFEYLALAHSELAQYGESARYLLRAIELNPEPSLYKTLADTYYIMDEYDLAISFYRQTLRATDDAVLVQSTRLSLAEVFLLQEELDDAEEQIRTVLDANEQSADAHFLLGEVLFARGNEELARFQWREARRIDPNHADALVSLQTR